MDIRFILKLLVCMYDWSCLCECVIEVTVSVTRYTHNANASKLECEDGSRAEPELGNQPSSHTRARQRALMM